MHYAQVTGVSLEVIVQPELGLHANLFKCFAAVLVYSSITGDLSRNTPSQRQLLLQRRKSTQQLQIFGQLARNENLKQLDDKHLFDFLQFRYLNCWTVEVHQCFVQDRICSLFADVHDLLCKHLDYLNLLDVIHDSECW